MMMVSAMKSYFCKNCGRDYRFSECLRNGQSLYCFKCPSTRLNIAGLPLVMVGISLLALFLAHRIIFPEAAGRGIIFLPAGFGIALVGFLRIWQAYHRRKRWKNPANIKTSLAESEKTAVIKPKPPYHSDPKKWDSTTASAPAINSPGKAEV